MIQFILPAIRLYLLLTVLTGVLYPGLVTALVTPLFPAQAAGSLVAVDGVNAGSALVGQANQERKYFWPRPSAVDYMTGSNAAHLGTSGATNASVTNAELAQAVQQRAIDFRTANGLADDTPVPAEMLFASGSGLDPHISLAAAQLQVERVAAARKPGCRPSLHPR
ncbi:MAG: potassium-transporting ATPase subunit C [Caldilineaceae bacterium]